MDTSNALSESADQETADIPQALRGPAEAALEWINAQRQPPSGLTGLVDYDAALNAAPGQSFEMGLVLCDGNICSREQVRVTPVENDYTFNLVDAAPREIPTLLDPPIGIRSSWIDTVLARHEFVVLLFYRGLW